MKAKIKIGLGAVACIALGAAATEVLHAQAKPLAYFISEVVVTDENSYKEYTDKFRATFAPFGGKFIVRAGQTAPIPGAGDPPKRVFIAVFESFEKAKAWSESAAIAEIRPLRDRAAKVRAFLVEGTAN